MKDLEARVWQRVQQGKEEPSAPNYTDSLPALIMEQMQLSNVYLQLSRQTSGQNSAAFMRLARESRMQAVCLKGIVTLMNGHLPAPAATPAQTSPQDALLRRCYGKELRLQKAYESRNGDVEYGPVFDRMAGRSRDHCCTLLELIGTLRAS